MYSLERRKPLETMEFQRTIMTTIPHIWTQILRILLSIRIRDRLLLIKVFMRMSKTKPLPLKFRRMFRLPSRSRWYRIRRQLLLQLQLQPLPLPPNPHSSIKKNQRSQNPHQISRQKLCRTDHRLFLSPR